MKIKHLLYLFIAFVFLAIERVLIVSDFVNYSLLFTRFLEIQLFGIYASVSYRSYKKLGLFNLFTLFLLTLGLFNFMKIFYGLFFSDNYRTIISMIPVDLEEFAVQEMLWVYTLFIVVIYVSHMAYINKLTKRKNNKAATSPEPWMYGFDKKIFIVGRSVMWFTVCFVLYRCYIEINYFSGLTFTELYIGGSRAIPIPSYVRILSVFFQVGFMMVLASKPPRKKVIAYSVLYIVSIFPMLLIGLRNTFALTLLFIVWYYIKVYDIKVQPRKLLLPLVVIILLFQIIAINRDGGQIGTELLMLLPLFLTYQSTSMYVLALYIQHQNIIIPHNYPYILDPVIGWLTGVDGQSLEVLEKRSSLGHQMIYTLSPDAYLGGQSLGTTCIAELYEFGWLGVIIGAILLSWAIAKFEMGIKSNRYYLLLSMFFCSYILIVPRSTFFPNVYFLLRYIIAYGVIIVLWLVVKEVFKNKGIKPMRWSIR